MYVFTTQRTSNPHYSVFTLHEDDDDGKSQHSFYPDLVLRYFKIVTAHNFVIFKVKFQLKLCEDNITDDVSLKNTFSFSFFLMFQMHCYNINIVKKILKSTLS